MFDTVDGGIAATFTNGPKEGQVGVVTPDDDVPPKTITFLGGRLVYVRKGKAKVKAADALGREKSYDGVAYAVDPQCAFMKQLRAELAATKAGQASGKFEVKR